ncbi:uncharacterized protein LOC126833419 [Adelges cooleyi]|uniref:uncharacterized protein LOC126833419 n=1 Tax=Adelges cooleyi TaxID=133065 RepID=UPI00217F3367|nr:uncharacterized protein LOC126833419 [Adelges cooleyi]
MATIRYFFIVLSVCVFSTFADDSYEKDAMAIYKLTDETAFIMFVEKDGINPQNKDPKVDPGFVNQEAVFILKQSKDHKAYMDVIVKLLAKGIKEAKRYGKRFTFKIAEITFGTIFVQRQ